MKEAASGKPKEEKVAVEEKAEEVFTVTLDVDNFKDNIKEGRAMPYIITCRFFKSIISSMILKLSYLDCWNLTVTKAESLLSEIH